MMLDFDRLMTEYDMKVYGVLHAGAHLAEEAPDYARHGIDRVWWVEANPAVRDEILANLTPFPGQSLVQALIWDADGVDLGFNITNYDGMSSSVYPFGTHPTFSPDTVFVDRITLTTKTIRTIWLENSVSANLLVMDLQGAEGPALRGAGAFLDSVDYVITEVNDAQVYEGCTQVEEIDALLPDFERVETYWVAPESTGPQGWGDSLLVRRDLL